MRNATIGRTILLTAHCLLLAFIIPFAGCGIRRTPDLARIFATARERRDKRPVIVIPGILGSQLVNAKTKEIVWPALFRSTNDDLRLPVTADLAANRDDLQAERVIDTARFVRYAPEIYIYYELLQALKVYGGYREGDWENPASDGDRDTYYVFAYDWRRDNVETARTLVKRIAELKRKLNRPDLRFNILAHSMGGLVASYAAMYGDTDLPADADSLRVTWAGAAHINKLFMFATPFEGSMEAFASLLDGYSATDGLRPRVRIFGNLTRDVVFTAPAMFQLLPHSGTETFLDGDLKPLAVDLYDPEVWRHYNWSIYADKNDERKVKTDDPQTTNERSSKQEDAEAYLAAVLRRARLFQSALERGTRDAATPIPIYTFGGDCEETLAAPLIIPDRKHVGRWLTLFRPQSLRTTDGRKVSRRDVTRIMFAPGDGRVTRRSLLGERLKEDHPNSILNTALPLSHAVFVCDLHGDVPNNKNILDNALTLLVGEVVK